MEKMYTTYQENQLATSYVLLHHINNCLSIYILLEKRYIKCIYSIINNEHLLHSRIALYSLYNGDTTLGENI